MNFGFLFINPEHFPVFFKLRDLLFMHVISDVNAGRRRENPAPVRDREVLVSPAPGQGATGRATMLTARSPRLRGGRNNGVFQWRLHKLKSFIPHSQTRENLRIQGGGSRPAGFSGHTRPIPRPAARPHQRKRGLHPRTLRVPLALPLRGDRAPPCLWTVAPFLTNVPLTPALACVGIPSTPSAESPCSLIAGLGLSVPWGNFWCPATVPCSFQNSWPLNMKSKEATVQTGEDR